MSTRILENRFELEKELSQNDFSTVYLGCDRKHFQRPQCLVIGVNYRQPEMRYRLEREAQVLERIGRHPQVPRLLAYFNQPNSSKKATNRPLSESDTSTGPKTPPEKHTNEGSKKAQTSVFYIVQEHLSGHPLSQEITPGKKLSESYATKLLHDILVGLCAAHNQGVTHQNLHPRHIIRQDGDGQIFLTHFGTLYRLATSEIAADGTLKRVTPITPHPYLAPEQLQPGYEQQPQPASDLYTLGLIAIEALTGKPHYHFTYDPNKGLLWREGVDVSLPIAEFIDRLVRHDWQDRFPDAQSALNTLGLVCARHQVAHNSRLPTVVAAPGGRISTEAKANRAVTFTFGHESNTLSSRYPSGNGNQLVPDNPYLLKLLIGSLAVLIAIGIGVKTYQWGQHRLTQLPQTWENWQTPSADYPEATAEELTAVLEDGSILLRPAAAEAFWKMVVDARKDGVELYPLSGFRTAAELSEAASQNIESDEATRSHDAAKSDYPTGYAIDIGGKDATTDWQLSFAQTAAFQWLEANAEAYGFELSIHEEGFPRATSLEPWHWRYVNDAQSKETFGIAE
ncbi:MAG: D-alanyl-D-alanine carboxypeptidase family protein [Cyanobacteria bacterium J06623_4]